MEGTVAVMREQITATAEQKHSSWMTYGPLR